MLLKCLISWSDTLHLHQTFAFYVSFVWQAVMFSYTLQGPCIYFTLPTYSHQIYLLRCPAPPIEFIVPYPDRINHDPPYHHLNLVWSPLPSQLKLQSYYKIKVYNEYFRNYCGKYKTACYNHQGRWKSGFDFIRGQIGIYFYQSLNDQTNENYTIWPFFIPISWSLIFFIFMIYTDLHIIESISPEASSFFFFFCKINFIAEI